MSKLFRHRANPILSSRLLIVFVIIIASFLAAFLGQMAINELTRVPSLLPLQNSVIRTNQDSLSQIRRVAQEVSLAERSSLVDLYERIEPQASEPRSGLVLTNDGWIVLPWADGQTAPLIVRLQSGELLTVTESVEDPYAPLLFVKVESQNLRPANLSTRQTLSLLEPVLLLGINGDVRLSYVSGSLLSEELVLRSDRLNRFDHLTAGRLGQSVYDADGEIVGIIVREQADADAKLISGSYIRESLNEILRAKTIARAGLGISYIDLTAHPIPESLSFGQMAGALITGSLSPASAGAKAGLRTNDIVVAVEGTPLSHRESLSEIIAGLKPDQTVSLSVLRRGEPLTVQITTSVSSSL